MFKKDINQNDILSSELLNIGDYNYKFNKSPINRIKTKPTLEDSLTKLQILKKKIESIDNCKFKKNSSRIVFNDGDIASPLMIIGDGPDKEDDKIGKPFMSESGNLLNKMLMAINLKREKTYITNIFNYLLPEDSNPEQSEINKYAEFAKEHISIINPKIIILMGSLAMGAIVGKNKKISQERGKWKEIIIGKKNYKAIITFHPSYLIRKPDQKKFSWNDLKIIKKEIKFLNIKI